MASSFKICSGTTRSIFPTNWNRSQSTSNQSNPSVFFPKKIQKHYCCHVSRSLTISNSPLPPLFAPRQPAISIPPLDANIEKKNLEKWMKESVEEIIKNLKKAPLLVHIYADGKEEQEIRAEHAVEEEWEVIMKEWEKGQRRSPDGLIFVEELRGEEEEDGVNKVWGIVVQGRGGCSPVCYLLKTTRVGGGVGLGLFCTHFSLIRVTSFRETALSQFTNSWLLH